MIITNTDPGNLQVDGVYTMPVLVPPTRSGPATGRIAIVGGGNDGPVNTPTPFSDSPSLLAAFGNDTVSPNAIVRAGLSAMPEGQDFLGVRVTDGTDLAAVLGVGSGGNFATGTLTVAGTPAAGNTVTATLNNGAGTVITTPAYQVKAGDTVASVAAALVTLINASAVVVGNNAFIQPCSNVAGVITIYAAKFGTAGNSILISGTATGGGVTITPNVGQALAGGSAGGSLNLVNLTRKNTGSLANKATLLTTLQSGSAMNTPVIAIAITYPNAPTEVYNNIVCYATVGGAFSASVAQANIIAAINGTIPNQAGSPRWTAVAGNATTPPVFGNPQLASGGTDGTSGLTTALLLGTDGISGRTGLYSLRSLVSSGQVVIAGLNDPAAGASLIAFRQTENCIAHLGFPLGTTTAQAVATRQNYALADPGLVLSIDWDFVFDTIQGQSIYVPPSAKVAGIIASMASYLSPGNQPGNGAAGVIGTERITQNGGGNSVGQAEAAQRQQNGILYLGYMPRYVRGPQLGLPHGMASDGITRISDYRMLCQIIDELQAIEGQFVDGPISTDPNNLGAPTFGKMQDAADAYFGRLKNGSPQQISDYKFLLGSQNTPTTVGQGQLIPTVLVATLSSAQFIVNLLQVGPNVVANVQTAGS